ncbi:MAG: hypothetical protein ACT4P7_16360 [Gemmatimonadaceae bacterium]
MTSDMFAYGMLGTASRNLGWQTHYLNLVYTPRRAMSAIIAAEAMHRLPRMRAYGSYPRNTRFSDFHISHDGDLSELVARDAFLHAGSAGAMPPEPAALRRDAGYGSSAIVCYDGEGIYGIPGPVELLGGASRWTRRGRRPRAARSRGAHPVLPTA